MLILFWIFFILIVFIDQITKIWASAILKGNHSIVILEKFLKLNYVENRGAAFGILQNKQMFFIVVTILIIVCILYFLKKNNNINNISILSMVLITGGAIGNLIDRIRLNYVVDFIDVTFGNFYDFPVFNIADSFVVIGTFILAYLIMFNKFEKSI